jgi:hypothetical protein
MQFKQWHDFGYLRSGTWLDIGAQVLLKMAASPFLALRLVIWIRF